MAAAVLRQATRADIEGMWRVRYAVRENTLTPGRITDQQLVEAIEETGRGWVIEEDGDVVAFAIGNAREGSIWALFVDPACEGRGHGSRLHDVMVAWLFAQGLPRLWLTTAAGSRARRFYGRRGWRVCGQAREPEVCMELEAPTA